jgi:hypothetical protein
MLTIQIVPKLFPAVDGVGDYALSLAHQLRQDFEIETHFLVGDPNWSGEKEIDGFKISQVTAQTSQNLVSTLTGIGTAPSIVLQYVGGGYAKRACPTWLVNGLARYQADRTNCKLVTMFHETYGSGPPYYGQDPPWISAFWLAPLQRNIAGRLASLSHGCITSRAHFKEQLNHLTHRQETSIAVAPVFSNVGEAQQISTLKNRQPILAVFGGNRSRSRVYEQFAAEIRAACQLLEIEKIYDIGPSTGLDLTAVGNVPVVCLGEKTVLEIGKILLNSRAGILNYHPEFLAKSGMYAAYSAYGVMPIVVSSNVVRVDGRDGLHAREHYWPMVAVSANNLAPVKLNLAVAQTIASNAATWYRSHNLSAHAQIFANAIRS